MSYPFKDYEFYGNRYVNIKDPTAELGERMWYDRDTVDIPTECVICIEAENEMYTKYAHPKAHLEAHTIASNTAESLAIKEKILKNILNIIYSIMEENTIRYTKSYIKNTKKSIVVLC